MNKDTRVRKERLRVTPHKRGCRILKPKAIFTHADISAATLIHAAARSTRAAHGLG